MSNIFPLMKPVEDQIQEYAVDSAIDIEIGDLCYLDTDDAKPASSQADQGSEPLNQVAFAENFIGIAASAHRGSDGAGTVRVRPLVLAEYPCTSATFEVGDLVGADEASNGTELEDQSVKKVTDLDAAIGVVVRRYTDATTKVWCILESTKAGSLARRLRSSNGLDSDQTLADNVDLFFGTGEDAALLWSTGDASNHTAVLALGDSNQALHVTDKAARGTDWNVSADTHPTLYVHSNTTPATDYLKVGAHDGTAAEIDVVGGTTLNLKIAGSMIGFVGANGIQNRGTAAVTATTGGGTTGLIPAGTSLAIVTSDSADKQISLPAASVGDEIEIYVPATGCELISAVTAHTVNGVVVGETNELALAVGLYRCKYVATNTWLVTGVDAEGVAISPLTPNTL